MISPWDLYFLLFKIGVAENEAEVATFRIPRREISFDVNHITGTSQVGDEHRGAITYTAVLMSKDESPPSISPPETAAVGKETKRRGADLLFDTDDLQANLVRSTARGGLYTAVSTGIAATVTTLGTVLITRELTDDDFGLYGMVLVLAGFARMFVDLGLSQAVIQKPQVNHAQVSTLFWINFGIATLLAVCVAAATPLLVWFYDEPRIAPVNLAMAGLFVVSALGLQHRALLRRRLEFGRLNIVATVAPLLATAVAVVLALRGAGVWALVAIPVVSQLVTVAGMWIASGWIPGWPRRGTGVRSMLAFGGHVTGFQFVNYFARNGDNAMLGFAWGAGPLGLYTRAYSLMMLPANKINAPLTGLVVPLLSRLTEQPDRFRKTHVMVLLLLTSTMTPAVMWTILTITETVPLLFGPQWEDMIPVYIALGPACLMGVSNTTAGWLYLSLGHVHRQVRWVVIQTAILLPAMAIGLQYGALGMAVAVSVVYVGVKPFVIGYATRGTFVHLTPILVAIFEPVLVSGVAAGGAWAASEALPPTGVGVILVTKTVVFATILSCWTLLTPRGRRTITRLRQAVKLVRKR